MCRMIGCGCGPAPILGCRRSGNERFERDRVPLEDPLRPVLVRSGMMLVAGELDCVGVPASDPCWAAFAGSDAHDALAASGAFVPVELEGTDLDADHDPGSYMEPLNIWCIHSPAKGACRKALRVQIAPVPLRGGSDELR